MSVQIVVPHGAFGASADDSIIDAAMRRLAVAIDSDRNSWAEKYGADFENDTFLMHRFCWCEQDDCPWCASCQNDYPNVPHASTCYQGELDKLRRRFGEDRGFGWSVPFGCEPYNDEKRRLCELFAVDYECGNEVHCTCGAQEQMQQQYDACQCDWHLGNGQFRFGPATDAPNFWHKPTGLRLRWYKYIGRDMEMFPATITAQELDRVIDDCMASIRPTPEPPTPTHPRRER